MKKKRMTLLAKKQGMSTSDFRNYWAGPHAKLALGMSGIAKYLHNRVDKVLWASGNGGELTFRVDGVVELYFDDEDAMRSAQASAVGRRYIPADEPNFLMGWTLCVVESEDQDPRDHATKVVVPFLLGTMTAKEHLQQSLTTAARHAGIDVPISLNWTTTSASREKLWSEPNPPTGIVVLWFKSVVAAHEAFDEDGALRMALERETEAATAYLVDELTIR